MTTDEKLDKILESVATHNEQLKGLVAAIKTHDATLFGNGQPGLKERFQAVEIEHRLKSAGCVRPPWWQRVGEEIAVKVTAGAILAVLAFWMLMYTIHSTGIASAAAAHGGH